jgi:hypothetical protein
LAFADCAADDPDWKNFAPDEYEILPSSTEESGKMLIKRKEVPRLLTNPLFLSGWREWTRYRRFGLPHGGGWRNEKPLVVRVIEVFEQEFEVKQSAEMEKMRHG